EGDVAIEQFQIELLAMPARQQQRMLANAVRMPEPEGHGGQQQKQREIAEGQHGRLSGYLKGSLSEAFAARRPHPRPHHPATVDLPLPGWLTSLAAAPAAPVFDKDAPMKKILFWIAGLFAAALLGVYLWLLDEAPDPRAQAWLDATEARRQPV